MQSEAFKHLAQSPTGSTHFVISRDRNGRELSSRIEVGYCVLRCRHDSDVSECECDSECVAVRGACMLLRGRIQLATLVLEYETGVRVHWREMCETERQECFDALSVHEAVQP